MKRTVIAMSVMVTAMSAHAQSSVLIYGILDEGLQYNTNSGGGHQVNLDSTVGPSGSRLGFRGYENLGGGLGAVFALESGLNINNGQYAQGGTAFGRLAYVGLKSDKLGTLTLGRQRDPMFDIVGPLDATNKNGGGTGGAISAHPGDLDNLAGTYRVNNAIKYSVIPVAGLSIEGMYSLGGVAGNTTASQVESIAAGFSTGPVQLGAGLLYAKTPFAGAGLFTSSNGLLVDNQNAAAPTSRVYSGFTSAKAYQAISAGGAYKFGAAAVSFVYSNTSFSSLGGQYSGEGVFNNFEIGATYQATSNLLFGAAYNLTHRSSVDLAKGGAIGSARYNQIQAGADYSLSKRTDAYLIAVGQQASGTDSTGRSAVASINGAGNSSNNRQLLIRLGLRHFF